MAVLPQLFEQPGTDVWRNTPWTRREQIVRDVIAFIGWWLIGTWMLAYSVVGWFAPLFPAPWYVLIVSAILALVLAGRIAY